MERRNFIKVCGLTCIGAIGLSMFAAGCTSVKNIKVKADKDILKIEKSNFIEINAEKNTTAYLKAIIVSSDISDFPVVVYRNSENDYTAILLRCTHQGSELNVNGDMLTCPAHGSEFDKKGKVLQGPAEDSLISFPVEIQGEFLLINMA